MRLGKASLDLIGDWKLLMVENISGGHVNFSRCPLANNKFFLRELSVVLKYPCSTNLQNVNVLFFSHIKIG